MTNLYAVMGNPIAHSLSPEIHRLFAKQTKRALTYDKLQVDTLSFEQDVKAFFHKGGLGLNITLPFKERAFALSEELSARARLAGAVNTLSFRGGRIYGDNTDGIGLLCDLSRFVSLSGKAIALIGAGGAARGVIGSLLTQNPKRLVVANRSVAKAYALQKAFPEIEAISLDTLSGDQDVIINATSSSTLGEALVLPESLLKTKPFCYDLAYLQTGETAFVALAHSFGCDAVDGLGMLVEQAAEAFFIWHGVMPETRSVREYLRKDLFKK